MHRLECAAALLGCCLLALAMPLAPQAAAQCADDAFPDEIPAYHADFESGLDGFSFFAGEGNLWHRTNACAVTLPSNPSQFALHFGRPETCDYDLPGAPEGGAASGFIDLRGVRPPMNLAFRYFIETDGGSPLTDRLFVNVSNTQMGAVVATNNPSSDITLCDPSGEWRTAVIDISEYAGFPQVSVSFTFATLSDADNDFQGVFIDDVRIYGRRHSADLNGDGRITLSELLRVIQLFNAGGYHCANPVASTEDGYVPGPNPAAETCANHESDYNPPNWQISLSELLRLVQFFNSARFEACAEGEDGYCPVN